MTRVTAIVETLAAFQARYGAEGRMPTLAGGQVIAKPPFALGPDDALLWPFSPQLKRTPENCDAHWRGRDLSSPVHIAGRSLYARVDGFSYYHWLLGTLPKLLFAMREDLEWQSLAKIFVNPPHKGETNFQTESLAMLGVPPAKLIYGGRGQHFKCDELTLPPEPCMQDQTVLHPWARELLRDAFLAPARSAHPDPLPRRFYISRAEARRRRLVNEDEVIAALAERGYRRVVLEGMPFASQIALFDQAEEIVGLHGAGLTNAIFARPGARLVEIMPETCANRCFAEIAAAGELAYVSVSAEVEGEDRTHAADARVDLDLLTTNLNQ